MVLGLNPSSTTTKLYKLWAIMMSQDTPEGIKGNIVIEPSITMSRIRPCPVVLLTLLFAQESLGDPIKL